ncbi:hypothetical protein S101413_03263 [Bacillus velezensis]|nr:hypothetical protein S101413_03263 [Bacillus velezensis]
MDQKFCVKSITVHIGAEETNARPTLFMWSAIQAKPLKKVKKRIAKPLNRMIYKRKELFYTALFNFRAASLFEISP